MRIFLTIAAIMSLVLMSVAMAVLDEASAGASVTVNTFVSITLTDAGSPGVNFISSNPGDNDVNDTAQTNAVPAIRVTNDAISNVNVKVDVKGTDFADNGNNFVAGQATYDDDGAATEVSETGKVETALANTYPGTGYYTAITPTSSADFWFFLDIPSGQAAGTYSNTLTFRGDST